MKKAKLLFIIFTCGLLAACGKNDNTDVGSTELDIPGVEVVQEREDIEYIHSEQKDGSLMFTIKGKWTKKQKWTIQPAEDAVASVKEVSQSNKKAEYHFTAQKEKSGYSEYPIHLVDTETNKTLYNIMFSVIADTDGKLSVLNVYGYIPSEENVELESEEAGTEDVETEAGTEEGMKESTEESLITENLSEEELAHIQDKEEAFNKLADDLFIPEELTVSGKNTDTFEGEEIARINLGYKENVFNCMISPSVSVSELKKEMNSKEEEWKTKKVGEKDVYFSEIDGDMIFVWDNKEGFSFVLSGRNAEDDITFEVVKLMIGNE